MAHEQGFRWNEERQVQVRDPSIGVSYLPVIPYMAKSRHNLTRVENGTIIRFVENFEGSSGGEEDHAWIFCLRSNPLIQFLVPSSSKEFLWKFKIKPTRKLR